MLLIVVVYAAFPQLRNWAVVVTGVALGFLLIFIGSGRIYRPAVTRTGNAMTCRFNPWREGTFYLSLFGLPLFGIIAIAGSTLLDRGSPSFWRFLGVLLIAATPVPVFVFVRQGRRSLLRITPFALTAAIPGQRDGLDEIPREAVEAIGPTTGRLGNGTTAPVTQITFNNQSVMFGPTNSKKTAWLTVEQADLQAGLQAWKDGDPHDPGLMDRVESILRGKESANG